jgi:hypothetical protein
MSCLASNRFLAFVFTLTNFENPDSQRYIVANGIKAERAFFAKTD